MKTYVPQWKRLPRSIIKEYKDGSTCYEIGIKHKCSHTAARTALVNWGVKMRPPGSMAPSRIHHAQKLSPKDIQKILDLDDQNLTHMEIGRRFNVTRERIRQICLAAGHSTRRSRVIPKMLIKQEQINARKIRREEKAAEISHAWKSGMSLKDLAVLISGRQTNISYAMNEIIRLREKYGAKWFPYRRPNHWQFRTSDEQANRVIEMSKEWKENGDIRRIQKLFGYSNYNSANSGIANMRKRFPHLFPTKEEMLKQKVRSLEGNTQQLRIVK